MTEQLGRDPLRTWTQSGKVFRALCGRITRRACLEALRGSIRREEVEVRLRYGISNAKGIAGSLSGRESYRIGTLSRQSTRHPCNCDERQHP